MSAHRARNAGSQNARHTRAHRRRSWSESSDVLYMILLSPSNTWHRISWFLSAMVVALSSEHEGSSRISCRTMLEKYSYFGEQPYLSNKMSFCLPLGNKPTVVQCIEEDKLRCSQDENAGSAVSAVMIMVVLRLGEAEEAPWKLVDSLMIRRLPSLAPTPIPLYPPAPAPASPATSPPRRSNVIFPRHLLVTATSLNLVQTLVISSTTTPLWPGSLITSNGLNDWPGSDGTWGWLARILNGWVHRGSQVSKLGSLLQR